MQIGIALMQKGEPMRAIDADELWNELGILYEHNKGKVNWNDALMEIKTAPTIEPEQRWIPVSERLPKEKDARILKKLGTNKMSDYVIATVEVKGKRMTVTACTYDGKWDWDMKYAFPDYKIVAWMPLPEPYGGEQNEHSY